MKALTDDSKHSFTASKMALKFHGFPAFNMIIHANLFFRVSVLTVLLFQQFKYRNVIEIHGCDCMLIVLEH